jgi:hypothetical protein
MNNLILSNSCPPLFYERLAHIEPFYASIIPFFLEKVKFDNKKNFCYNIYRKDKKFRRPSGK